MPCSASPGFGIPQYLLRAPPALPGGQLRPISKATISPELLGKRTPIDTSSSKVGENAFQYQSLELERTSRPTAMASRIPDLRTCKKVGFIVPSSNSVVEPTCNAIVHDLNSASNEENQIVCLYTRIRVKTVGTDSSSTSQFSTETLVQAAQLLADAECDAILWNGTSGMWVGTGLAEDEKLAQAMTDATGVPCSTTTIATVTALREKGYGEDLSRSPLHRSPNAETRRVLHWVRLLSLTKRAAEGHTSQQPRDR